MQKQAHWYTMLQEYLFKVILKPGLANTHADALSHQDQLLGEEGIPDPIIMLSNTHHIVIDTKFAVKICAEAENKQPLNWFNCMLEGWKAGSRLYVPTKLRVDLMTQMHDHLAGDHFNMDKTHKQILKYYMWSGSHKNIKAFIQRCSVYV